MDLAGFSRLMEADEEGTHAGLMQLRTDLLQPSVTKGRGQIVKHMGDGLLATFDSALDCVSCAIALQRALLERGVRDPVDRRLAFRMGINLSDTIVDEDDIFGEGVNIAARLQGYAEPGGIVVTSVVAEQIEGRVDVRRVDLGELHLKNIRRPVRAYSLHLPDHVLWEIERLAPPDDDRPSIAVMPFHMQTAPASTGTSGSRDAGGRPSVAVLPFRKLSSGDEDSYFADGIVDDIIRSLSGLKDMVVISRGSTLGLGGQRADPRVIGEQLGVRYVLNGGIVRSGGRIRINTELSDAASGTILRAERHDGDVSDLFELQDRISLEVVATLAPHIREQELKRVMRKHPDSMDAYDLVLQAIDLLHRMEYRPFSGARGLLQQARVHDGNYAPAYAYAAQWHTFRIGQGWSTDMRADSQEAARLASEAIERDRYDATALAICGHARSFLLHDYAVGRDLVDRALEAGPSNALAWNLGSCTCSYMGEGTEAVRRAQHSLRLSPRDPLAFFYLCNMGIAHYANGEYEEAVRFARRAAAHKKTFRANLRMLVAGLMALGQAEEARAVADTLKEVDPEFRLTPYRNLCPWQAEETREQFIERLRAAGLPD